jgi:hypothetical protein
MERDRQREETPALVRLVITQWSARTDLQPQSALEDDWSMKPETNDSYSSSVIFLTALEQGPPTPIPPEPRSPREFASVGRRRTVAGREASGTSSNASDASGQVGSGEVEGVSATSVNNRPCCLCGVGEQDCIAEGEVALRAGAEAIAASCALQPRTPSAREAGEVATAEVGHELTTSREEEVAIVWEGMADLGVLTRTRRRVPSDSPGACSSRLSRR